jgi:diguanylate cyclase (GGDEF)-like protein
MERARHTLADEGTRRLLPFVGAALVALLSMGAPSGSRTVWWFAVALTVALGLLTLLLPWSRLPAGIVLAIPLGFLLLVALIRHVEGGAVSGFAPLTLLAVVWVALYRGRRDLAAICCGLVLVLAIPILWFGAPQYPPTEWRRVGILLFVGVLMGLVIQHLVRQNVQRSIELTEQARSLEVIARTLRDISVENDPRLSICEAVLRVGSADRAWLLEPDGEGNLKVSAHAGQAELPDIKIPLQGETSGSVQAFTSGRSLFVADASTSKKVSARLVSLTEVSSALFEPVARGEETIGVLMAGWLTPRDRIDDQAVATVRILASEVAVVIDRADLLAEVRRLAETDSLTGLTNRRRFMGELEREIERARRGNLPTCLAMLDIDHFKIYNDEHGHLAGDDLLRRAAAAWAGAVRSVDTLGRYGGEEFALLLPRCSLESAAMVIDRLRAVTPKEVTVSAGVASLEPKEESADLIGRADEALYEAKRRGRDGFVLATVHGFSDSAATRSRE